MNFLFTLLLAKRQAKKAGLSKVPKEAMFSILPGFGSNNPLVSLLTTKSAIKSAVAKQQLGAVAGSIEEFATNISAADQPVTLKDAISTFIVSQASGKLKSNPVFQKLSDKFKNVPATP